MDLKDQKILITGGAGFLGKNLTNILVKEEEVPLVDIITPRSHEYDLRKSEEVERLFVEVKPNIVIHLACKQGGVGYMKQHSGQVFYENLLMNTLVAEAARRHTVRKFVGIGTGMSYPAQAAIPLKEEDFWSGFPETGNAPYGLASRVLLAQLQFYRKDGLNGIYLILPNLYGSHDHFNPEIAHVIPSLILRYNDAVKTRKSEVEAWGTGNARREFLYGEDAARGIILALKKYEEGAPLNLGSGEEITMRELTEKIAKLIGYTGKIVWDVTKSEGPLRRCFDSTHAQKILGFQASISFDEGLLKTLAWYRHNV